MYKGLKNCDSKTVPLLLVNGGCGFMLRRLVYVTGRLVSRTSQGDWELCTSPGSACSQSANWEVADVP